MDSSYESIMQRCLARLPANIDKRPGSIVYDALAPAVAELSQLYIEISTILDRGFADTAVGADLTKKAMERSIHRQAATKALRKATFRNTQNLPMEVPLQSRFSGGSINYRVKEALALGQYKMEAEATGEIGNAYFGELLPIDYIPQLGKAMLEEILIPGEDEENDENLRARYFQSLQVQAFGGNVRDYTEKMEQLPGVGAVKVEPTWQGGGTVRIVVIASNWQIPSSELLDSLQETVDPHQDGDGFGLAPIGHIVSIVGVEAVTVDVSFTLELAENTSWEGLRQAVEDALSVYLLGLRKQWAESERIIVRIAQCETVILQIPGVVDIRDTKINDVADNLSLSSYQIPMLGAVNHEAT